MAQQKNQQKPNENRSKEGLNLPAKKGGKSGKKRDNLPPKDGKESPPTPRQSGQRAG